MLKYTNFYVFLLFSVLSFAQDLATIQDGEELLERYNQLVEDSPSTHQFLNEEQRKMLLQTVSSNPVASISAISLYDPPQNAQTVGEIGYCYGRAMAAHLLARKMGLAEESISKIFAGGDMQNGAVRWRFHMSTLVKGEDTKLYAIDPIMPGLIRRYNMEQSQTLDPSLPLAPQRWTELVKFYYDNTESILEKYPDLQSNPLFKGTVKFYTGPTHAIMVDMREVPAHIKVENGDRLIGILFSPEEKGGFDPQYFSAKDEANKKVGYYNVSDEDTLDRFFTTLTEPLVDRFDFFHMKVDIFYISEGDVLSNAERNYLYNGKLPGEPEFQHYSKGYFPSLIKSVEDFEGVF